MLIAVISDTHMPRGARRLPDACVERIEAADLLVHAGDFQTLAVVHELEAIGPPLAGVHGNVDSAELRRLLPAERIVEADGVRIAMVHDAGPRPGASSGCGAALASVPTPWSSVTPTCRSTSARRDGFQIFNPGSPTERRRAPLTRWGWRGWRPGGRFRADTVYGIMTPESSSSRRAPARASASAGSRTARVRARARSPASSAARRRSPGLACRSLLVAMGEEPVLSSPPLASRYDAWDLRAQRAMSPGARLESALATNRFASELTAAGRRARSGADAPSRSSIRSESSWSSGSGGWTS